MKKFATALLCCLCLIGSQKIQAQAPSLPEVKEIPKSTFTATDSTLIHGKYTVDPELGSKVQKKVEQLVAMLIQAEVTHLPGGFSKKSEVLTWTVGSPSSCMGWRFHIDRVNKILAIFVRANDEHDYDAVYPGFSFNYGETIYSMSGYWVTYIPKKIQVGFPPEVTYYKLKWGMEQLEQDIIATQQEFAAKK